MDVTKPRGRTPGPEKSELFTNRIDCVGHLIRPRSIEELIQTIDTIGRLEYPNTVTEL